VPSLRTDLINDRTARLVSVARHQQRNVRLTRQFQNGEFTKRALTRVAGLANAQVFVYQIVGGGLQPVSDGPYEQPVPTTFPLLQQALRSAGPVAGRTPNGSVFVVFRMPGAVVAMTQRLGDVNDAAELVQRQIIVAAGLALALAVLVGWAAAVAISQRLSSLEAAATRVAAGRFDQPISDPTPDELGRVAQAFDLMQSRLEQIDRSRKDFIANASHELRTPLFSLAGFVELMQNEDLDERTRQEFLLTMREQVSRLTKLATDLLDLSRLDAGAVEMEHEPIDLRETARALVREFRGLAAKHGSRVVLARADGEPPEGIGDEQRVQQIGRVMVDNAIRHTPRGTQIRVAVSGENGRVRLAVADDGPGIDSADHDRLFERFYRGDAAGGTGSGLGLAIARELAHRMEGDLCVTSEPGRTEFTLELPTAAAG
ncbi:MAG TPA: ATP-binding protein, partial [Gaiellales bacterium]|nr:ATP-binding protein [Gaiellales bacterium]